MSRQINLYSAAFRAQPKLFSAMWTVVAVLVVLAAVSADYAWNAYQLRVLRAHRNDTELQLKQSREQLVAAGQVIQKTRSKSIEQQVERAEILASGRQELIGRLQRGEIGNREGYSKFLTALARQHREGIWLTRVEIFGAGNDFAMEGRALRPELLPEYIKTLRNEEVLRGKPVGTLALHERVIDPPGAPGSASAPGEDSAAAVPTPAAAGRPPSRAGARVLEFTIGTGTATGVPAR